MKSGTWKAWERKWGEWLGGVRVPITGRGRGSAPDVQHPLWAIEVKAGAVMSPRLQLGMKQAIAAVRGSQTPLLCISQRLSNGRYEHYVMLRLQDWQDLHGGTPVLDAEPNEKR